MKSNAEKRRRQTRIKAAFLMIFAFGLPIISGCSAGGYLIGSASDKINRRGYEKPKYHARQFEQGQTVRIVKTDSTIIEGEFAKIFTCGDSAYAERHDRAQDNSVENSVLPTFGSVITVQTAAGVETSGEFVGYDIFFLDRKSKVPSDLEWPESAYESLNLKPLPDSPTEHFLLKDIDSVTYSGHRAAAGIFRGPSESGTLPLRSSILVMTDRGQVSTPFNETAEIRTFRNTNVRWILFGIGLAIDVALVVYAISMANMGPLIGTTRTY